jgi:hypothetical protein
MNKVNWKSAGEFTGIAAIVGSLIFVGVQLVVDQDIAESQAYIESAQLTNDQTELLTAYRDIWIAGLDGDELEQPDEFVFQALVWAAFQRKVAVWQRRIRLDAGDPQNWINSFAIEIYLYPGLRRAWNEQRQRRSAHENVLGLTGSAGGYSAAVQNALEALDREFESLPEPRNYILR